MDRIAVEKVGGFSGFGGPGSNLTSKGEVTLSNLPAPDRATVESLFSQANSGESRPDAFRYRLTRQTPTGLQTIEIPESHVPESVKSVVVDTLK